jgi:hypothetical protein
MPTLQPKTILRSEDARQAILRGECGCGCGGKTLMAQRSNCARGLIKGQPNRFILSHQNGTRPIYDSAQPFFIDDEPCKQISLTLGYFAIVDADIYETQWNYKWYASIKETGVYAVRNPLRMNGERGASIYLHRVVMQTPVGQQCDHIHHSTLDNRRSQLRNCIKRNNTANVKMHRDNVSGYKGVTLDQRKGTYFARIMSNGVSLHLGTYNDPIKAARVYDAKAIELHGEFACLNFPQSQTEKDIHAYVAA